MDRSCGVARYETVTKQRTKPFLVRIWVHDRPAGRLTVAVNRSQSRDHIDGLRERYHGKCSHAVRENHMTVMMQSGPADPTPASGEFEGEIREFIRKDVAPWRRRPDPDTAADTPAENVSMVVQRVAGASLGEIDNVIGELRSVRDF